MILEYSNNRVRILKPCEEIDAFFLTSPLDVSSGLQTPEFKWSGSDRAFRYDVHLDTANPPQRIVASDIETTSFSLSGLESLTTYYWKVVAKGDPFCDPFRTAESEVWSFTTTSSCDVPGGFGPN